METPKEMTQEQKDAVVEWWLKELEDTLTIDEVPLEEIDRYFREQRIGGTKSEMIKKRAEELARGEK